MRDVMREQIRYSIVASDKIILKIQDNRALHDNRREAQRIFILKRLKSSYFLDPYKNKIYREGECEKDLVCQNAKVSLVANAHHLSRLTPLPSWYW